MDSTTLFYFLGGYAVKLAHVLGAVAWLGGVLFMGGVATPILKYYARKENHDPRVAEIVGLLERRLIGFNWMGLFAVFFSGLIMSLYSSQSFSWFRFDSLYDWVLHLKLLLFVPVAMANYLLSISYRELQGARARLKAGEDLSPKDIVEWRIISLRRINVYLAFTLIILIALL